ncbi:unnamed protein product [Brachionus calyciflorus]|uniref:Uncharacterized protein n=1 Tax=Brachionus calyciflorus TaxID=104777 RepID=A0A813R2M6_9BILA|nr:unnamed protein product [Brachionus calyciflorus]
MNDNDKKIILYEDCGKAKKKCRCKESAITLDGLAKLNGREHLDDGLTYLKSAVTELQIWYSKSNLDEYIESFQQICESFDENAEACNENNAEEEEKEILLDENLD